MKKFENYVSNLAILVRAPEQDLENEFVIGGIIDKFYIQFELGWKVLKELLRYEGSGIGNTGSPREIIKGAYRLYDFMDETLWLGMLKARNDMAHIYSGADAKALVQTIITQYIPEFVRLEKEIRSMYGDVLEQL